MVHKTYFVYIKRKYKFQSEDFEVKILTDISKGNKDLSLLSTIYYEDTINIHS